MFFTFVWTHLQSARDRVFKKFTAKAGMPLDGAKLLSRYYNQDGIDDFAVGESSDAAAFYDWALY